MYGAALRIRHIGTIIFCQISNLSTTIFCHCIVSGLPTIISSNRFPEHQYSFNSTVVTTQSCPWHHQILLSSPSDFHHSSPLIPSLAPIYFSQIRMSSAPTSTFATHDPHDGFVDEGPILKGWPHARVGTLPLSSFPKKELKTLDLQAKLDGKFASDQVKLAVDKPGTNHLLRTRVGQGSHHSRCHVP
jgi:hypothetical protein